MPQPIVVNGRNIYRPGVYSKVDVSALAGTAIETNRMAVVGNFPFLEQNKVWEFATASDLVAYEPSADILKKIAQLVYNTSTDPRVQGGPSAILLVSGGASTQAAFTVGSSFVVKSSAWGATGKRVSCSLAANADNASAHDFTVARDGISETHSAVFQGVIAKLKCTSSDATTVTANFGPETGLEVTQEVAISTAVTMTTGLVAADELAWGGEVITISAADPGGVETLTFEITGLTDTGTLITSGSPETVTVIMDAGDETVFASTNSVNKYVRVDTLKLKTGGGSLSLFKVSTKAFKLPPATYPKLSNIVDAVNANSASHKYTLTLEFPKAANILTAELDEAASGTTNALNTDANMFAELQFFIDEINAQSALVQLTRGTISESTNVGTVMPAVPASFNLINGVDAAAVSNSEWATAFSKLDKSTSVQIIVPITDDVAVGKLLVAHCNTMASTGMSECNAWFGTSANQTIPNISANFVNQINSRHVAVVGQSIKVVNWLGKTVTYDPWALALVCAGVQSGTGIAVPMTHKRLGLVATLENAWNPSTAANTAIKKGICVITKDRIGYRIERSVTSYVLDDNAIFSEVSANESLNTCIRDLRAFVEGRIGDANTSGMADLVKAVAMTRLRTQIEDGIIKAFDENTLAVVDLGDRLRIDLRVAVVEPINFITINAEVVRNIS